MAKNVTSHLCGLPIEGPHASLIPTYSVFIGFAVVAVVLRVAARILTQAFFWWDDFANLFGFVRCDSSAMSLPGKHWG